MSTTALLGDIGGTNARFARAVDGEIDPDSLLRLRNDDFPSFDALLVTVLDRIGPVGAISLSVAGPVSGGDVQMTNRPWVIRRSTLAEACGGPVEVMNDMTAFVLAVPHLRPDGVTTLREGQSSASGQWLVVNVGTGFNAAPGLWAGGRPLAVATEIGQTALPATVADILRDHNLPVPAPSEALLSGPGLARLRGQLEADSDAVFARCLGAATRELITAFLPTAGVFFCGGVAEAMASGPARDALDAALARPYSPYAYLSDVPVRVITEPGAALRGCLAALT